jgi:uncharacterized protein YdeI (YjbR/CyaY-like superfamily)
MEELNGVRTFNPANRSAWRKWLSKNYTSTDPVWVAIYHKGSEKPNLTYADVVEEALCFGWIDNRANKRDEESMYLRVVPRKEKSSWSKLNRERAERMIKEKLMTKAGQVFIDLAKKSGKWDAALESDVIPPDAKKAFAKKKKAFENFQAFAPFSKRMIVQWITEAKRPETRKARIDKTVELATKNIRAKP